MRILHVSDNHGRFPKLTGQFDIVVNSGDMSPNFQYDSTEASKQQYWWDYNIQNVKDWLGNKPFLFTLGNHDFFNGFWLQEMLRFNGIKATCLHNRIVSHEGVNFYGLPYVPPINGKYNFETTADEFAILFEEMGKILNATYVDVLVAHCPPSGTLDLAYTQQRFGNSQMSSFLDYTLAREMQPGYYLTGHIHDCYGVMMRNGMLVSNAATSQNIIEV